MVRVIAGTHRSQILKTPEGNQTRPTSDRLKETLFNLLQSRVEGSVFLDLFAGSGSIGIEALSRGAAFAVFVESAPRAVQVLQDNLERLELRGAKQIQLFRKPVATALRLLQRAQIKFDIVFLDPPYEESEQYSAVLKQLQQYQILKEAAWVIAEHSKRLPLSAEFAGLTRFRMIRQSDSMLSLYKAEIGEPHSAKLS